MRKPQLALPAVGAVAVGEVQAGGVSHWLFSDGRTLPVIRGGAPEDDPPAGGTGGAGGGQPPAGAPPAGQPRTFDQAELDRVAAREKSQGERAGQRKLLQTLGFDPETCKPEDAKKVLDDWRAAQDASKDQATRDREAAATDRAAAAEDRRQAGAERHSLAVAQALIAAGLPGDDVADIGLLVKTEVGADAATVKQAVEDLKKKRPALFGPAAPGGQQLPGGDPGTPGRGADGGGTGKSGVARGKAKAQELGWAKQPA